MSLLDFYWPLASDDPKERVGAAEGLLKGLQNKNDEKDWAYALKRLVTGLASPKGSARLGFSMALAELLRLRAPVLSIEQYLELSRQSFKISANAKGVEERGLLFGKLFALQTLAKSPLWNEPRAKVSDLHTFVAEITDLSLRKIWLREPAFFALCELVRALHTVEKYEEGLQLVFKTVYDKGLSQTCEGVALALSVGSEQRAKFNKYSGWESGNPLFSANLQKLARILRELPATIDDDAENQKRQPVHFVWKLLAEEFGHTEGSESATEPPQKKKRKHHESAKSATLSATEFWNRVVDEEFFAQGNSAERKRRGLEIFITWMLKNTFPDITFMFTPQLLRAWALQLANQNPKLNKTAKKASKVVQDILTKERKDQTIPVIERFVTGISNFDKMSKSKLVHTLVSSVEGDANFAKLIHVLLNAMKSVSTSELARKQWALDNVVYLLKQNCAKPGVANLIHDVFNELIPVAFFLKPDGEGNAQAEGPNENTEETEETNDKLAQLAQERIMSLLSCTLGKTMQSISPDPQSSWPFIVFKIVLEFQKHHPEVESRIEFDDETLQAKEKAEHTLQKIHKKRNSSRHVDSPQLQAFELLFAMVLLQVYSSVPDAVTMLDELQLCYQQIKSGRRAQEEGEDSGAEEKGDEAAVVLTEILISLLSQQSTLLRKLSEDVWRSFTDQVGDVSLKLLVDILEISESPEGQRTLFNVEDDEGEAGSDEENSDPESEDVKMDSESSAEGEEEDDENEADEDEDDEEDEDDDELDEETKRRLAGTLGVRSFTDADQEQDESSSDESMDDEEMSALDGQLAAIFRERRNQQSKSKMLKKENARARQDVASLKSRVLDLLDIFFAEQPSKTAMGLGCIMPVLQLLQTTKERQVGDKGREFLRTRLCRKTKFSLNTPKDVDAALKLLGEVQALAGQSRIKALSLTCNQVAVFLAKLVLTYDPSKISEITQVYSRALEAWYLEPENQTMPSMFVDLVNYLGTKKKT